MARSDLRRKISQSGGGAGAGSAMAASAFPTPSHQAALGIVPGLSFLAREAHQAGLETVSAVLSQALADVMVWIEEGANESATAEERH